MLAFSDETFNGSLSLLEVGCSEKTYNDERHKYLFSPNSDSDSDLLWRKFENWEKKQTARGICDFKTDKGTWVLKMNQTHCELPTNDN